MSNFQFAISNFQFLPVLCVLCVLCPAYGGPAELMLDAAEYDRFGVPFDTFAAFRIVADNSKALTDMTDVRFKIDYTGTMYGIGGWTDDHADNPWLGAPRLVTTQIVNGIKYVTGSAYLPPTQEWAPNLMVDPTPNNPDDWENDYEIMGMIPAGVRWDKCLKIIGDDIYFFQSPATGTLNADGTDTTLYDYDPMPQTVPGPCLTTVLALGGALLLRRRPNGF